MKRFMSLKDLTVTPAVTLGIWAAALQCTVWLNAHLPLDWFLKFVAFYVFQVAWAIVALKIIRTIRPVPPGIHRMDSTIGYSYNLQGCIHITHLHQIYTNNLIPIVFRKLVYQLLGARIGDGIVIISGRLGDPLPLVTIEESAVVGDGALLLPHAQMVAGGDVLVVGPIHVKRRAIVGARTVVMPNVTIGEDAVINAMSLVPMNTVIGPGEIWGGIPAKKLGESGSFKPPVALSPQPPQCDPASPAYPR